MRPVEIEFLVKDSTKAGAQRVSASIDRETMKVLGRMNSIQAKIDKLRNSNSNTLDQSKNIAQIKKLEDQLEKLQAKLGKLSATSIGPSPDKIAQTTRQYNGLNTSIQQIARELPSLAMGPQMFFMAISNNLPIFTDELARARAEYARFSAEGKKAIPVWRQLLSSIVSWQTLLAVGVMLLVTYGDEISNWVMSLFKGSDALNSAKLAAEQFHSTMAQGTVSAQKEITSLELLYKVATDTSKTYSERKHAVEELQQSYPTYFANLSTEQIMLGNAISTYQRLREVILQTAQAKAAEGRLVEIAESKQLLDSAESMKRYSVAYKELANIRQEYEDAQQRQKGTQGTKIFSQAKRDADRASASYKQIVSELKRTQKDVFKELKKIEGGEDLIKRIDEFYGGDLRKFLDAEDKLTNRLSSIAESAYSTPDYKQDISQTAKLDVKYRDLLLQAMQDLEDDQLAIIEDGYEKRRKVAQNEFNDQLRDIREKRQKLLAQDQKETGGANKPGIDLVFDSRISVAASKLQQTLSQIDKEQDEQTQKAYDKLLERYETFLQKRERLAKQYDKDIEALSASPENRIQAEKAKEEALRELDVAFASQFPEFEQWANAIVTKSVDKLRELIALAEVELETMENEINSDPEAEAILRAQIAKLEQKLSNAIINPQNKGTVQSPDEWMKLSEVLQQVNDDLQEVGDTMGGVIGEIVDAAGQIATSTISIISGIKQLAKTSTDGVKTTAGVASSAIKGVERASVILTIISGALSIIQALSSVFKETESSQERNIRLAEEFNEELRILNERAKINKDDDSIFGDAVYRNFRNNIDVMRDALQDLEEAKKALIWRGDESFYGISTNMLPWQSASESVGNMKVQTQHSTWFRSAKYASLKDLIPELFGDDGQLNMDALKKFADESNNTFQHLSNENKKLINSLVADWETYEEALNGVRDYLSSIFGDLGNTIMDSMLQVADGTMSAADAMTIRLESLSGMVKEFATNMIYAMTIGPLLERAQADIEKIYSGSGSEEAKAEAMVGILSELLTDVGEEQNRVNEIWNRVNAMAKERGIDLTSATTQTGKAGATYTVSQDSFTRAEGILTSIQAHVISGDLKIDNITQQLILQLNTLNTIAENTMPISQIYSLLLMISRDGIKAL